MRHSILVSVGVLALSALPLTAQATRSASSKAAADEVIAATRAQWAAEMKKDVAGWGRNVSEEATIFEAAYPTRLDGKATLQRIQEGAATGSDTIVTAEMANEKVQVYGDVAVLTYNYIGAVKSSDGKIAPSLAKSTRVYVRQGGQWMLVHANFAPVTAPDN